MLKTVVLLCSVHTAPADCTKKTALQFYPMPAPTVACGLGDAMAALAKLRPEPGVSYVKLSCERAREATW